MKDLIRYLLTAIMIWAGYTALKEVFNTANTDALNQQYRTTIDSLQRVQENREGTIHKLQSFIDSIKTKQYDTVYIPLYRKADGVKHLSADSTVRLFNQLHRQLQDSSYRARYFRPMPNIGNIKLGSGDTVQ